MHRLLLSVWAGSHSKTFFDNAVPHNDGGNRWFIDDGETSVPTVADLFVTFVLIFVGIALHKRY